MVAASKVVRWAQILVKPCHRRNYAKLGGPRDCRRVTSLLNCAQNVGSKVALASNVLTARWQQHVLQEGVHTPILLQRGRQTWQTSTQVRQRARKCGLYVRSYCHRRNVRIHSLTERLCWQRIGWNCKETVGYIFFGFRSQHRVTQGRCIGKTAVVSAALYGQTQVTATGPIHIFWERRWQYEEELRFLKCTGRRMRE